MILNRRPAERLGTVAALMRLWGVAPLTRRSLVELVVGLSILLAGLYGLLSLVSPWAYSITFGPTLTGNWMGELHVPNRGRHLAYLELRYAGSEGGDDIYGRGRVCDEQGRTQQFDLSGSPHDRRGSSLRFTTNVPAPLERDGLHLNRVEGKWDGGNTLSLRSTADVPALQFSLRRGSEREFENACSAPRR